MNACETKTENDGTPGAKEKRIVRTFRLSLKADIDSKLQDYYSKSPVWKIETYNAFIRHLIHLGLKYYEEMELIHAPAHEAAPGFAVKAKIIPFRNLAV